MFHTIFCFIGLFCCRHHKNNLGSTYIGVVVVGAVDSTDFVAFGFVEHMDPAYSSTKNLFASLKCDKLVLQDVFDGNDFKNQPKL